MKTIIFLAFLMASDQILAQETDLSVDIRLFQSRIITGDFAKMEITIRNEGPNDASGVGLNVDITQGLFNDIITTAPGPCQISVGQGQVRCQNVGDFPVGAEKILLVKVQLIEQEEPDDLILSADVISPSPDPNISNNNQLVVFNVDTLPNIDNYASGMLTSMPAERRALFARATEVLGAYCSGTSLHSALDGFCDDLLQQAELGDFETITRVMSWMRPRNVVHQARNSTKLVASQISNLGQRMAQLRAGINGFTAADLQLNNGSESLPVSMLGYQGDNNAASGFISPWGFFINGSLSTGDFDYTDQLNDGFDFDSDSLSAGVDYRFSNRFVLGAALGYNQMDSNTGSGVHMTSEGASFNLYGLYTPTENFYIDTRVSFARPDIKQTRVEFFNLIDEVVNIEAVGRTQSDQFTIASSAGYNFNRGAWNWSPYITTEYVNNSLDQFTETGAGGWNIFYSDQEFKALKYNLGFNISRAISTHFGVLSPQLSLQHNYEDQDDGVMEMRLIGMPIDELFNVETNFTESSYSQATLGLTWVAANGKVFYLRYQEIFGLRNFDQQTISLGTRFEF